MVLGKLPVPGRPTSSDCSRARAHCACSRCGWGLFGHFYSPLKYCLKGPLSPKQPTNQPILSFLSKFSRIEIKLIQSFVQLKNLDFTT